MKGGKGGEGAVEDLWAERVVGQEQDGGLIVDESGQSIPDADRRRQIVLVAPMPRVVAQLLAAAVRVTTSVDQRRFTLRKEGI